MTLFPAERNTRPIGSSLVLRLPLFSLLFKSTPRECARAFGCLHLTTSQVLESIVELGSAADFDNRSGLGCRLHRRQIVSRDGRDPARAGSKRPNGATPGRPTRSRGS